MSTESRQLYPFCHHVYFKLADRTPKTFSQFITYCRQYLSKHEGLSTFALGVRAVEMERQVNDQHFDVCMIMIFDSVECYDKYRLHPDHDEWITVAGSMSVARRVFDCYVLPEHLTNESETPHVR